MRLSPDIHDINLPGSVIKTGGSKQKAHIKLSFPEEVFVISSENITQERFYAGVHF